VSSSGENTRCTKGSDISRTPMKPFRGQKGLETATEKVVLLGEEGGLVVYLKGGDEGLQTGREARVCPMT